MTDVLLSNLQDGQILQYDASQQKFVNVASAVTPSATLSLSSTSPVQTKTITQTVTATLETIGQGASKAYAKDELFVCVDGHVYKASAAISQNTTLVVDGNCTLTDLTAEINGTNTSLTALKAEVIDQTAGNSVSLRYETVAYQVSANTGFNLWVEFPFITKNTNYSISFTNVTLRGATGTAGSKAVTKYNNGVGFMTTYTNAQAGSTISAVIEYTITFA